MNWEYKVSNAPTTPRELQAILERDGIDQWELVSTTLISSRLLLLYKRSFEYATEEAVATEEAPALQEGQEGEVPTEPETEMVEETTETYSETGEEEALA